MTKAKLFLIPAVLVAMTGCAGLMPERQPTPEERALQQQMMKAYLAKLNRPEESPAAQSVAEPAAVAPSESQLLDQIDAFPAVTRKISFVKKQDGLLVEGKRLNDPEGVIKLYGYDAETGDVTYLIKTGTNDYVYKYLRAGTGLEPVKLADATFSLGEWRVTTTTGKSYAGSKLVLLGRGFVLSREDGSGYVWRPGKALQNFTAPEGFQLADYQNGDIAATRYLLCERMIEADYSEPGSIGGLVNSVKNLGSTLGIGQKEDYLLLNVDSGVTVPINISYDNKNEAVHSNCTPSGKFVNQCANVQFFESLYDKYGRPNGGHYYWAINWYNTASGPLLLFKDNNGRDLIAQNLKTNEKAVILTRMLGINWFTSSQGADGKVSVTAKMGFGTESVADVESTLAAKIVEAALVTKK